MIPGAVYDGLSQWNSSPEGSMQGEFQLLEKGYATDGSYFQYFVNDVTGDWYVIYWSADPDAGGQLIRTESRSQSSDP